MRVGGETGQDESGRGSRAGRAWEGKQGRMRVGGETGQEERA